MCSRLRLLVFADLLTFDETRVSSPNPNTLKAVRCDYALKPWRLVSAD